MSYCARCGKWSGAIAAPAGTEPTWCTCPKDLTPVVALLGHQLDIQGKEIKSLKEALDKTTKRLNNGDRAGAANSWDMLEEFRDEVLENDPLYEAVRQRRANAGNVGAASNMIAYIEALRSRVEDLERS
jgi:hypothetical protein